MADEDIRELRERACKLGERLGIPRHQTLGAPIGLWSVIILEKLLDSIERLEDNVYGKR